jgi:hypothetical protein
MKALSSIPPSSLLTMRSFPKTSLALRRNSPPPCGNSAGRAWLRTGSIEATSQQGGAAPG